MHKPLNGHRPPQEPKDLTRSELQAQAEDLAHRAGLPSAKKAFALLDAGKLDGTILESELRTIRFLQKGRALTTA